MGDIVIIGAGECGVRAAFALREAGHDGAILLVGEEPHLPYERPPLSKNCPVAAKPIAEEARYAQAQIELLQASRAEAIDRAAKRVHLADGRSLVYDKLLLATGARARRFPGMEAALTLRSLDDAHAILEALGPGLKLAIVGGGFIGLELAATARGRGAAVTVIEAAPRPMARIVPGEIAEAVAARHRAAGVELILGTGVTQVREDGVALSDGRTIDADMVVAGVGAAPETRLAEAAGLKVDNGILVDGRLATSDPHIFAAGDCCRFPFDGRLVRLESWRAAQDQGTHAARAMLGSQERYASPPWFWSDQYDLTLQVAGLPDPARTHVRRALGDGAFVLFELDDAGRLAAASGIGIGNAVAKDIRLAEMMIEKGLRPDPARLADPAVNLKTLLKEETA
ncbi:NAD(P)/FAD-dependent oxidoreductase [Chelativorans intermedius]|uniref:NAD(P)/FAD-dependent oxidoreductase n=1 Tax=Chelativorans intermedius TaxID=515947 RepID=A0ABV6D7L3_9HYPH|nr:FAD-dependent oxidoreductase [Chelativorans intermedius]MCT8999765.1 FAD-dependent oxidoreductase [Chelativorans intermedius]